MLYILFAITKNSQTVTTPTMTATHISPHSPFQRRLSNGFDELKILVVKSANSSRKLNDDSYTFDTLDSEAQEFIDDSASNVFKSGSTRHATDDMKTAHESILLDMQFQFHAVKSAVRMRRRYSAPHNTMKVSTLPKPLTDTPTHQPYAMIRPPQSRANSSDSCDSSSVMSGSVTTCTSRSFTKDRCLERKEVEDMDRRMKMRVMGRTNIVPTIRNRLMNEDASFPVYLNRAKEMEHQLKENMEQEKEERQSRRKSLRSHSPGIHRRKSLTYTPIHRTIKSNVKGHFTQAPSRKDYLDDMPAMTSYLSTLKRESAWTVELPKGGLGSLTISHIDNEVSTSIEEPVSTSRSDRMQRSSSIQNVSKRIIERVVITTSKDKERRHHFKTSGRSSSVPSIQDLTTIVEQKITEAIPVVEGKPTKTKKLSLEQTNEKVRRRMFIESGKSPSVSSFRNPSDAIEQNTKHEEEAVASVREKRTKKKLTAEQKEEKDRRRMTKR
jgi:hypothetical protein